jgi:Family of unknown function (DUF5996)
LNWPALPYDEWKDTLTTLHLWTQIVGKIRLNFSPWTNHSWHVTLYVTARGLTTSPMWFGDQTFEIEFDFIHHRLLIETDAGHTQKLSLTPRSVANFYQELLSLLKELGIDVHITTTPNEIADGIPFPKDDAHRSYDPEYAHRFWQILVKTDRVMKKFRARFIGKSSPVHFFWGGPDLAVTRFSGRMAPQHPGGVPHLADWVTREAYSHEVCSCGFWPGNAQAPAPIFYSYAYPEPDGFKRAKVVPAGAYYSEDFREFLLPYDSFRNASSPDDALIEFFQSVYEAAASFGKWDRAALERDSFR